MGLQTGLLEKRQNERKDATWEVIYQAINKDEAQELRQRFFTREPAPKKEDSDFSPAITSDWSDSGLCIMTGQSLTPGSNLIIYLQRPSSQSSVILVAEVVHNAVVEHPLSCVYRTGVRITGVNKEDWLEFTTAVEQ
jgi:hypothetical protein